MSKENEIVYYVNKKEQITEEKKLTPRSILTNAGYEPNINVLARAKNPGKILEQDKLELINHNEKFISIPKEPTPVSIL